MNLPKRQHTVAQMLQARFTNTNGNLYFFNKRAKLTEILEIAPSNLFVERHVYSRVDKAGAKDPELERFYSQIEGGANTIIEKIVTTARSGRGPTLTAQEKEEWDLFFHHQWKRSPDFYEKTSVFQDFDNRLANAIATFERDFRQLTTEERNQIQSDEGKARLKQNAKVDALLDPGPLVADELDARGLGVIRIAKLNKSFAVGSFPIVKVTSVDPTQFERPTQIWFPISFDVAVTPAGKKGSEQFAAIDDDRFIRAINLAIANQSAAIGGCSKALIQSLAKPR